MVLRGQGRLRVNVGYSVAQKQGLWRDSVGYSVIHDRALYAFSLVFRFFDDWAICRVVHQVRGFAGIGQAAWTQETQRFV